MTKRKVAIFDIDGTIFRSSLLIELVNELIDGSIFPESVRKEYGDNHKMWLNREGEYQAYIEAVVAAFMRHLKGVHYSDFMDAADRVIAHQQNHVYRYTRDLIKELKKDGYYLLAVSHSPKAILEGFCKGIGFDKVYGKLYELGPENRFTGNLIDEHLIQNKAKVIHRAVEKENLTLENSVGVGDSQGDIPLLEMVKRPICFNPSSALFRIAKLNKWEVVIERKDMIYKL